MRDSSFPQYKVSRQATTLGARARAAPPRSPARRSRPRHGWLPLGLALIAVSCLDRPVAKQEPTTSNSFVESLKLQGVDKVDLVFMIDNSASMGDKHKLLAQAVPRLLRRLLNPPCAVAATGELFEVPAPTDACPRGEREFPPLEDVHVAVISSSLGTQGGTVCSPAEGGNWREERNDHGQLLGLRRPDAGVPTFRDQGFLAWNTRDRADENYRADAVHDLGTMEAHLGALVTSAGESGCGYESSLEAWYRFLVDPNPPLGFEIVGGNSHPVGIDEEVLAQRRDFLRSDSLVAVVMLSDENDCSMRASGAGWAVGHPASLPRGSSACTERGPHDPCCYSCAAVRAPAGCPAKESDAACQRDEEAEVEVANLRCWDSKRRFGLDLLYPTSRYRIALQNRELCPESSFGDSDCDCRRAQELGVACDPGEAVPNPLFVDLQTGLPNERDASLVYLAGIVGVPWQDLATAESRETPSELRYLEAEQLAAPLGAAPFSTWDLIVGDPRAERAPLDPYMVESPSPRLGLEPHPLLDVPMAPPESGKAMASSINGHEWNVAARGQLDDLQYACVFPLAPELRSHCASGQRGCDCSPRQGEAPLTALESQMKPLCQNPSSGAYEPTQYAGKAYPSLRQLEVLEQLGAQAIAASICPKILSDGPSYGYNPAVDALVDRLKSNFQGRCLPRKLAPDPSTGAVPCKVIEAVAPGDCSLPVPPGRNPISDLDLIQAVASQLSTRTACDTPGQPRCDEFCLFEVQQLIGLEPDSPLARCREARDASRTQGLTGYCYVDGDEGLGDAELVSRCPSSSRRILRFVGHDTPRDGTTVIIACSGASYGR